LVLQLIDPSDFGELEPGGAGFVTWIAFGAAAAGLVLAAILGRRAPFERHGAIAACSVLLLCLPAAVDGFRDWTGRDREGASPLSPGRIGAGRGRGRRGAGVWGDPARSSGLPAYARVYTAVAPRPPVAAPKETRPYARYRDAARFRRTRDLAIPR